MMDELTPAEAERILDALRTGIPPRRGVRLYSAGEAEFLEGMRRHLLQSQSEHGRIRFISGTWGSGKTHFLRLLREEAFATNYLVATVELSATETPFNKLEAVYSQIIKGIASPEMNRSDAPAPANAFEAVLTGALDGQGGAAVTEERIQQLCNAVLGDTGIDFDFRRMVARYWETFLPDVPDRASVIDGSDRAIADSPTPATVAEVRGSILQWFAGEGKAVSYRDHFGVQKIVDRTNVGSMLQSATRFARHLGYRGLVILLDEAEKAYSTMRKSDLKQAQNNLLHLINGVEEYDGLVMVYAATPDFYLSEQYGIVGYGALTQRIGRPPDKPPRALDRVWNIDRFATTTAHYVHAAKSLRAIYARSGIAGDRLPSETELETIVEELVDVHPKYSPVSIWRVVVSGTIEILDAVASGEELPSSISDLHEEVVAGVVGD